MAQAERTADVENIFAAIELGVSQNLAEYRRTSQKGRSREMQKAAFGDELVEVSDSEYNELIGTVRKLRQWLKVEGIPIIELKNAEDGHEKFWVGDDVTGQSYSMSYEPKPWEQSAGMYREAYSKFSIELENDSRSVDFSLNFDDTYYLRIQNKSGGEPFVIDGLKRKHMTKQEYQIVKNCIATVVSRVGIAAELIS